MADDLTTQPAPQPAPEPAPAPVDPNAPIDLAAIIADVEGADPPAPDTPVPVAQPAGTPADPAPEPGPEPEPAPDPKIQRMLDNLIERDRLLHEREQKLREAERGDQEVQRALRLAKLLKEDPEKAIQEAGVEADLLTRRLGLDDPDDASKRLEQRLQRMEQLLEQRDAQEAEAHEVQRKTQARNQLMTGYQQYAEMAQGKHPHVHLFRSRVAPGVMFRHMSDTRQETGKILSLTEAADRAEEQLQTEMEDLIGILRESEMYGHLFVPQDSNRGSQTAQSAPARQPTPAKTTLRNSDTATPAPVPDDPDPLKMTDAELLALAIAEGERVQSAKASGKE